MLFLDGSPRSPSSMVFDGSVRQSGEGAQI
jgi:hypothetical protein